MDEQLKKRWCQALRSGQYKRKRHRLKRGEYFSACGVLADIYEEAKWGEDDRVVYQGITHEKFLPDQLRYDIGLSLSQLDEVHDFNDNTDISFAEIADWIEENL